MAKWIPVKKYEKQESRRKKTKAEKWFGCKTPRIVLAAFGRYGTLRVAYYNPSDKRWSDGAVDTKRPKFIMRIKRPKELTKN